MPTYDYVCDACGHAFELFQQMTAKVKRTCPECGKRSLRRLVGTGAGVIFKGSGFYQTDYRSESYKKAAKADSSSEGKGDKKHATDAKDAGGGKEKSKKKDEGKAKGDGGS